MAVNRQICSLSDLRNYLHIGPMSVAFSVYCDADDASAATFRIAADKVYLTITDGAYESNYLLDFSSDNPSRTTYDTFGELADYINALGGWYAKLYGDTSGDVLTLEDIDETSVLGVSNILYVGSTNSKFTTNRLNDLLQLLINSTTKYVENYIKRPLDLTEVTLQLNGTGTDVLVLNHYPISSVSSIRVDSNREFASITEIDTDDYYVDTEAGRIEKLNGVVWPVGRRNVQITYTRGFSAIPDDLSLAGLEIAAIKWNESHQGDKRIGVVQNTIRFSEESHTNTFLRKELPEPTKNTLDKYRRVSLLG